MVRVLFSTPPVFVSVFVYNILSASVIVENILSLLSRGRSCSIVSARACSMAQDGMQAAGHDGKVWLRATILLIVHGQSQAERRAHALNGYLYLA